MFADALIPMAGGAFPLSDPFVDQRPASVLINPSGVLLQPDRWNTCVVTSASSVVLPPPAKGKVVKVHVSLNPYASTNLLTVNANGGENVGPGTATSRGMWAGESAVLVSFDGATWTKVYGLTIPMSCGMRLNADAAGIVTATVTKVLINATDFDNTGLMADTTNKQMVIQRGGKYLTCGVVAWNNIGTSDASRTLVAIYKNGGSTTIAQGEMFGKVGGFPHPQFTQILSWTAADTIQLQSFQNSGNNQTISGSAAADACFLQLAEIPSW